MTKKIRILITGIGSTTAISVIKGLRKQNEFNIYIVGVDINKKTDIAGSYFCNKFYKIYPAIFEKKYIEQILYIINKEKIDLVIPIIDLELEVIARNRKLLEKKTYILLSPTNTILICNDKLLTYNFFIKNKIPTVRTFDINKKSNITNIISNLKFPIILKPRNGVSSRDVYELSCSKDIYNLITKIKNPIIQEKAEGEEFTIDIFSDGKKLIAAVPRKRIETRSGISYKGETRDDKHLIKYVEIIVKKLKIFGPANIQCFRKDNIIKFIEINPRFSGSLPLTIAAGVNTPLLAIKMLMGKKLSIIKSFKKIRMNRYWEEIFYEL